MSVRKIQEYIDERIAEAEQELKNHEIHIDIKNYINILDIIKTMLDEVHEDSGAILIDKLGQELGI